VFRRRRSGLSRAEGQCAMSHMELVFTALAVCLRCSFSRRLLRCVMYAAQLKHEFRLCTPRVAEGPNVYAFASRSARGGVSRVFYTRYAQPGRQIRWMFDVRQKQRTRADRRRGETAGGGRTAAGGGTIRTGREYHGAVKNVLVRQVSTPQTSLLPPSPKQTLLVAA